MTTYKEITPSDIQTSRTFLNQLIDVLQYDISGSSTRRKYQVYVTGGIGPGVTSSLFQTVYDQDFTLQTSNPIFDATFGLYQSSSIVSASITGSDSAGKLIFPSQSLMMREKIDIYKQFAAALLGDSNAQFVSPLDSTTPADKIDSAFFITFKRLFHRDQIKRETFAMRFYASASDAGSLTSLNVSGTITWSQNGTTGDSSLYRMNNISAPPNTSSQKIFTDVGSSTAQTIIANGGGNVGVIKDSAGSASVGLIFYDRGVVVLDLAKAINPDQWCRGVIHAMNAGFSGSTFNIKAKNDSNVTSSVGNFFDADIISTSSLVYSNVTAASYNTFDFDATSSGITDPTRVKIVPSGMIPIGRPIIAQSETERTSSKINRYARFIPDFVTSGSIDDIVDHVCSVRMGGDSEPNANNKTAITFQNITNINSTLIFCRANADEFNYSSNPTYKGSDSRIVVIDPGQETTQQSFTFVTSIGLYDSNSNLLAVAKLSRPVEKSAERDLTFRVRLDF